MVYVLLDTNIIIDMVIDRRNNVIKDNTLKTFTKLLDYGEVKMILPKVISIETYRHLDKELEKVGVKINDTMNAIKNLYGISAYEISPLDLSEYKKNAREELHKAQKIYEQYKKDYQNDVHKTIKMLFTHANTISIDDETLMPKVLKRKVHKRAPFHKETKESYGDATIIESLINIRDFVDINPTDKLIFATGNYTDFSNTESEKDKLHPDIVEDLKTAGLESQVTYIRSFGELIHHLGPNVINAELMEEFDEEISMLYQVEEDALRESVGLTRLCEFANQLEYGITESYFAMAVQEQFERLNQAYNKLENLSCFFNEELDIGNLDCVSLIDKLSDVVECTEDATVDNMIKILEWIDEQKHDCQEIEIILPDYIDIGEDIEFLDIHRRSFIFGIDSLDKIEPMSGETDSIDVRIKKLQGDIIASGSIDVTYGFAEENSDGIGNACDEGVEYNTEQIIDKLTEFSDEWESFINKKETLATRIRTALGL